MIFKPAQLGMAKLDQQELVEDRKSCKKIGPCGVGKKALYLNSFYIDRRYYLPYGSISRVFKRVAMSSGGFTGKGMFAPWPTLWWSTMAASRSSATSRTSGMWTSCWRCWPKSSRRSICSAQPVSRCCRRRKPKRLPQAAGKRTDRRSPPQHHRAAQGKGISGSKAGNRR